MNETADDEEKSSKKNIHHLTVMDLCQLAFKHAKFSLLWVFSITLLVAQQILFPLLLASLEIFGFLVRHALESSNFSIFRVFSCAFHVALQVSNSFLLATLHTLLSDSTRGKMTLELKDLGIFWVLIFACHVAILEFFSLFLASL